MMQQMLLGSGAGGTTLPLAGITVEDLVIGGPSTASLTFNSSGAWTSVGNALNPSGTWLDYGVNSDYEIYFDLLSGTVDSGAATNTWLALSTTRTWTVTDSVDVSGDTVTGTLTIRNLGGLIISTCDVSITAFAEP